MKIPIIDEEREIRSYTIGYNDTERCVVEFVQNEHGWNVYFIEGFIDKEKTIENRKYVANLNHNYDTGIPGVEVIDVEPNWYIAKSIFYKQKKIDE